MKHIFWGLLSVLVSGSILYFGWSKYNNFLTQGSRPPEGTVILNEIDKKGAPNFEATELDGTQFNLNDYKNKILILSFWASWCEPCIEEFPSLINLIKEMNGDVLLIAVSADYNLESLNGFLKAFKVNDKNIKVIWDKELRIASKYGTEVLPESYIIGYDNKLIRKISGVDKWDSPMAIEFFKDIVSSKSSD